MDQAVIRVKGISKQFHLGTVTRHRFQEEVVQGLKSLFKKQGPIEEEVFWALKDISFELEKGDILGIIGRNGAGKSTLLKIISQIIAPTEGSIEYRGQLTSILAIGTGFHPDLSGRQNIYLNASLLGMSREQIEGKYDEIIAFSGVEKFIDTPVKHYSSGMYLRLAFSIAFHTDVDILVLDEILAVGDAEFRMKSYERIRELAHSGATIIIVSHNISQIVDLCNKGILIENGRIKCSGSPREIMDLYLEETIDAHMKNKGGIQAEATEKHNDEKEEEEGKEESVETTPVPVEKRVLQTTNFVKKWPVPEANPAHADFHLSQVSVMPWGKSTSSPIYFGDEIKIEFQAQIFTDDKSYQLVYRLLTIDNIQLIVDSYSFRREYETLAMPKGHYQFSCRLPARLLNHGMYSINVLVSQDHQFILELPYVLKFRILPDPSEKDLIWNKISPCIRPLLDWQVQKIN